MISIVAVSQELDHVLGKFFAGTSYKGPSVCYLILSHLVVVVEDDRKVGIGCEQ